MAQKGREKGSTRAANGYKPLNSPNQLTVEISGQNKETVSAAVDQTILFVYVSVTRRGSAQGCEHPCYSASSCPVHRFLCWRHGMLAPHTLPTCEWPEIDVLCTYPERLFSPLLLDANLFISLQNHTVPPHSPRAPSAEDLDFGSQFARRQQRHALALSFSFLILSQRYAPFCHPPP